MYFVVHTGKDAGSGDLSMPITLFQRTGAVVSPFDAVVIIDDEDDEDDDDDDDAACINKNIYHDIEVKLLKIRSYMEVLVRVTSSNSEREPASE
jgi:hypothetical protein